MKWVGEQVYPVLNGERHPWGGFERSGFSNLMSKSFYMVVNVGVRWDVNDAICDIHDFVDFYLMDEG